VGNWSICLNCYKKGLVCRGDDTHRLYAFPRAVFAKFDAETPYQRKTEQQTGRATCNDCGRHVEKGAYYRKFPVNSLCAIWLTEQTDCSKCDKGTYDLCKTCYQTGRHCRRNEHVLTKYYAWKYKRLASRSSKKTWKCSNPGCLGSQRENKFYFCKSRRCFPRGTLC
jgi:hypothetical protein